MALQERVENKIQMALPSSTDVHPLSRTLFGWGARCGRVLLQYWADAGHSLVALAAAGPSHGLGWDNAAVWLARKHLGTACNHRNAFRRGNGLVCPSSRPSVIERRTCCLAEIERSGSSREKLVVRFPLGV